MKLFIATILLVLISACAPKPAFAKASVFVSCDQRGCSDWATPTKTIRDIAAPRRYVKTARKTRHSRVRVAVAAPAISFGSVSAPARFIRGRLICAVNVGVALAERGIRGTGSALAKSYLNWGRPSGPVPGAVAVFNRGRRGGHVAIVHSVRSDGTVIYLNPSSRRQAWQIGPYGKTPLAYRVAS